MGQSPYPLLLTATLFGWTGLVAGIGRVVFHALNKRLPFTA